MVSLTMWPCIISLFVVFACLHINILATAQCMNQQKSLLLQLRDSLDFDPPLSTKLARWNQTTDCCQWNGVECNPSTGQVIGLDLSEESITGRFDNSSSLFNLLSLQTLNLANNCFDPKITIPSTFGRLNSLTYLNLSNTGFTGQVPIELSYLSSLMVLDISHYSQNYESLMLYMKNPNLGMMVRNLTNLRELCLDGVVIEGSDWGQVISSSLPHLEVLSLADCQLRGQIHPSLLKIQNLSVIVLDRNYITGPVPEFIAHFKNLTILSLRSCDLIGTIPTKIFQVPTLTILDLSFNQMLEGTLANFQLSSQSLEILVLRFTLISGLLPNTISNIKRLRWISLNHCNLSGIIPSSISKLTQLEHLDLSQNNFYGTITSYHWASLRNLVHLDLSQNLLNGTLPNQLFSLPLIQYINLEYNNFVGRLNEVASTTSVLYTLDLSNNNLEGPFPKSVFQFRGLSKLDLSFNRFNDTLHLNEIFHRFLNLTYLGLSHNYFSIDINGVVANSNIPQLEWLHLASCNLHFFPEFLKHLVLRELDLSDNQIQGKVPRWLWDVVETGQSFVNLSCNNFVEIESPMKDLPLIGILDLHSNKLQGEIPLLPSNIGYLDYSNNNLTIIPETVKNLTSITMLSLSKNNIYGTIPTSLCEARNLEVLDLGYNHLNGRIPSCVIAMSHLLGVLNLKENNLSGAIPDEFDSFCRLDSLDLNGNRLSGKLPTSLANCRALQVLDLGNNQLNDTFPSQLHGLSSLKVLILRSNRFHGTISCTERCSMLSSLQVLDLAYNNFIGELTAEFLLELKRMMIKAHERQSQHYLQYAFLISGQTYNRNEIKVTFKGNTYMLEKFLTSFKAIDLSNNAFHGELPEEVGYLIGLTILNLSRNSFSSNIPPSIGDLIELESLDLSHNVFNGSIPQQFTNLNFLEYLNLSFNNLSGLIPTSTQLQSFDPSAYIGNPGLYGPPLTSSGRSIHAPDQLAPQAQPNGTGWRFKDELEWMLKGAEVGFPVGITLFIGPLLYIKRWRCWYSYQVDRQLMKVLPSAGHGRRTPRGRATRTQRQR